MWRIKEYIRSEGGLPILARLVLLLSSSSSSSSSSHKKEKEKKKTKPFLLSHPPTHLRQLKLCLDVLESVVYLNIDNQVNPPTHPPI